MPDTYGYPGPEGKAFWAFLGAVFLVIWLAYVTAPLWTQGVN
jgi:hypothetical protein